MLNKEQLQKKICDMNEFLQKKNGNDEPASMLERMELLEILISQSGEYLADARYYQEEIINGSVVDALKKSLEEKLSASTINLFVKTSAKQWNHIVNSLERINNSASKQHAGLITRVSFAKTALYNNN